MYIHVPNYAVCISMSPTLQDAHTLWTMNDIYLSLHFTGCIFMSPTMNGVYLCLHLYRMYIHGPNYTGCIFMSQTINDIYLCIHLYWMLIFSLTIHSVYSNLQLYRIRYIHVPNYTVCISMSPTLQDAHTLWAPPTNINLLRENVHTRQKY